MSFPKGNWGPDGLSVDPSSPLVRFTVNGQQVLDNTPVELPINCQIPESLEMQMMRMIRQEVSRAAVAAGHESLDEAYDFEMAEDDSYEEELTPAELHAMVHARELTEEVPKPKEKAHVRERVGSGEGSAEGSGDGAGSGDDGVSYGREEEYAGNGKGDGRKDEAVRVRVRSDAGDGSGVGSGGKSARASARRA